MRITKQDMLALGALLLLGAFVNFYELGNMSAPVVHARLEAGKSLDFDFGEQKKIGKMWVFLGPTHGTELTLHVPSGSGWRDTGIKYEFKSKGVLSWNEINVGRNVNALRITAGDRALDLGEIALTEPGGSTVIPANAAELPSGLFDEQDTFQGYRSYMNGTFFDEVYHPRTANEIIKGQRIYENTHPHLGKELMSLGIRAFGMNPFGWRFVNAVFGTIIIGVMYVFAKAMFKSTFAASITALFFTLDCMRLSLTRIATIDITAATFILLMYYFMYKYIECDSADNFALLNGRAAAPHGKAASKKLKEAAIDTGAVSGTAYLALSGLFTGLACATKWTGVFAAEGLAIVFFFHVADVYRDRGKRWLIRLFGQCVLFFIVLPAAVYIISFIPIVDRRDAPNIFVKVYNGTKEMFRYHSSLVSTHYYSSRFYEWPIIWKAHLFSNNRVAGGLMSSINCMGNPALWWPGILCVLYTLYSWFFRRLRPEDAANARFLFIAYIASYMPWFSISRITYIYHYFQSSIFMIMIIGWICSNIAAKQRFGKALVISYTVIVAVCFAIFYPVVAGIPVPAEYGLALKILPKWIIVLP